MNKLLKTSVATLALLWLTALTHARPQCPTTGPDVVTGDLAAIANYAASGGLEALIFGTKTCNIGDQEVAVVANTNQHYLVAQNLYRLQDKGDWFAFEQVGMSWLRHSFFALSQLQCCTTCTPPAVPGTSLGVGCSDSLSASANGSQPMLSPRWQIDAYAGAFPFPPANPPHSGSTARRIEVLEADLEPTSSTTTRYFGEVQQIAPDDALAGNGTNNASYRELSVVDTGPEWSFGPFLDLVQRERPALLAWQDVDPAVLVTEIDVPGEGRLLLASHVTAFGESSWHYEFALYNVNSDDAIRAFAIPRATDVALSNTGFHDVEYRNGDGAGDVNQDGTDWPATIGATEVSWEITGRYTPPGSVNHNALRWGTTYNFRFDADSPPTLGELTLTTYKTQTSFTVSGVPVPSSNGFGGAFCSDADGSLASCPCANPGAPDSGCDIQQGTGGVRLAAVAQSTAPFNRATMTGTGFPAASTPTSIVIRAMGLDAGAPVVFGDGLRCVGVPLVRLAAAFASGGTATHTFGHGAMAGAGTFYYQLWFRNTPVMFCDPAAAFNLSNGHTLVWGTGP